MKLSILVERCSFVLQQGSLTGEVTALCYDSRQATPGCLFVCIPGSLCDGHDFIPQALAGGASALVTQRPVEAPPEVAVLVVENPRLTLAQLSAAWFGDPARRLITIAVTGTKGKTTTACMIYAILTQAGHRVGLVGTVDTRVGERWLPSEHTTPESYRLHQLLREMVDAGCSYAVLEVSSQALKLARTGGILFDCGVFTNLGEDHISPLEHRDLEEYAACKAKLFAQCRLAVVNGDDPAAPRMLEHHRGPVRTFGLGAQAEDRGEHLQPVSRPGYLGIAYDLRGGTQGHVVVDIPCTFTVYNSLGAVSVCRALGIPMPYILRALETVQVRGRLETVPVPGDFTVMIDYAHNAMSLEGLLTGLRPYVTGRILCLFGCGGNRARARRFEMGEVSARLADLTIVTSDNPRNENPLDIMGDILTGVRRAEGGAVVIADRREAIRWGLKQAQAGDLLVLAGKGHETEQEIRGVRYPMDERLLVRQLTGTGAL